MNKTEIHSTQKGRHHQVKIDQLSCKQSFLLMLQLKITILQREKIGQMTWVQPLNTSNA